MSKPTLIVQTVYLSADGPARAEELGLLLYDYLSRPRTDKLGFGPGIPVRIAAEPGRVDTSEAEYVVVIPVLGEGTAQDEDARDRVFTTLNGWSEQLRRGCLLPVFTSAGWRAYEEDLPVKPLRQHLYNDQFEGFQRTVLELVISICRALRDPEEKLQIFVSHAKLDLVSTKAAAEEIRDFAKTSATARAFYDTTDLEPGLKLETQLQRAAGDGVFVAVRSDTYASRSWCQRELLCAKRSGIPTLTVDVLRDGEARSYPYGGNGPTIVWAANTTRDPDGNALRVILRAMVEWLRARHFVLEVPRLSDGLPTPNVLPRPPELLDLAQGPLLETFSSVVLHPDPELSYAEQVVLKAARPRIQLITPTTRYRAVTRVQPDNRSSRAAPLSFAALRDKQVALSISDVVDESLTPIGMRKEHLDDVVVYVARALLGAGACIAYGGNFRVDGFDQVFSDLISTYNAAGVDRAKYVYSYLPASFPRSKLPKSLGVNIRSLGWSEAFQEEAKLKPPTGEVTLGRAALYISDMRRVMAKHCFSRVVIGGQALPRRNGEKAGYGGPYPGLVEEAWLTLQQNAPLYVVGGFGGAAALVAALAEEGEIPPLLRASSFSGEQHARFRQVAAEFADDLERPNVGAPSDMESLVIEMHAWLQQRLQNDTAARAWNGLTRDENFELLRSRDAVRVAALIMKGQFNVLAARASTKLKIELVRGNITRLERADAVVLPTLRDVEIGGPGAALDAALNGAVSTAKREQHPLTQVNSSQIDADWLLLADLGSFATLDRTELPKRIEDQTKRVALLALQHGFQRLSLVTFGSTILPDVEGIAACMLSGFKGLAEGTALQWFESDKRRFERLRDYLRTRDDVSLVVRELVETAVVPEQRRREDAIVVVRLEKGQLRSTLLLPSGPAVSQEQIRSVTVEDIAAMNQADSAITPPQGKLAKMGTELAQWLFGPAAKLLDQYPETRLVVQHDLESSALPFESLRIGNREIGVGGGIVRRPSMTGVELTNRLERPPNAGRLKLRLIVNPTKNLENAVTEANEIRKALANDDIDLDVLAEDAASKTAVLAMLADPTLEVLHFCGHAEYRADAPESGGLVCANDETLTLTDLESVKIGPRIVFFNACQSARMRNREPQAVSRALAEFVLRSGVEAFLGTFWPVADAAAGQFAAHVYRHLAKGGQLDDAVLLARQALRKEHSDWANYALYGSGDFQLKTN